MSRRVLRVAAMLVATGMAFALAEGVVRARYSRLPSVAALDATNLVPGEPDGSTCPSGALTSTSPLPPREPWELWVVGDSVAAGMGVRPRESFAGLLQPRLARLLSRSVSVANLGVPGADACQSALRASALLRTRTPDVVLFALFADDLEVRSTWRVGATPVIVPSAAKPAALRWLVERSWLANLAWFAVEARRTEAPAPSPSPVAVTAYRHALVELRDQVTAAHASLVLALLAPAGLPRCPANPPPAGSCARSLAGLEAQRWALRDLGLPFLDLSHLWDDTPDLTLPSEQGGPFGDTPIHPNAEGHARLAEALEPAVRAAALAGR